MLEALQPNPLNQSKPSKSVPIPPAMSNMQTVAVTPKGYTPPVVQNQSVYVYQSQQDPKKKLLGRLFVTMIVGGAIGAAIALGVVIAQNGGIVAIWNKFSPFNKPAAKVPFYFLADSAFEDIESATRKVEKLKEQGYKDAGMFLISDYPNLGESKWQQVYAAKFANLDDCKSKLKEHLKFADDAYCALASPNKKDPVQRFAGNDFPPTPSPSLTVTPSKTATPPPSPAKPSPEIAIRDYYSLINERQFQNAWQNLTPKFQHDRAGGYKTFTDWWRTVDKVSINGARIVDTKENSAIIDIDLTYQKNKDIFPETLRMSLVWNESLGQWQINETSRQ